MALAVKRNNGEEGDGAQGRNRTTDTAIFSRMLYQLSYLGGGVIGTKSGDSRTRRWHQALSAMPGSLRY